MSGIGTLAGLLAHRVPGCRAERGARWMVSLALLVLCLRAAAADPLPRAEIWFNGIAPIYARPADPSTGADFQDLFRLDAPWAEAASKVRVFKVSADLLSRGPDDLLAALIADLKRRRIALALEGLMLTANLTPGGCGRGIEGYTGPDHMVRIAERIKRLGGRLDYVAMDEPLWYGHHFAGPNACRLSMPALAAEIAQKIAAMRRVFPDLRVGDIEPVGSPRVAGWVDTLMRWAREYEVATGEKMAFLHADVQWHGPWKSDLKDLAQRLRGAGISFGIIYNGDVSDPPDQWIRRTEDRFVSVESWMGLIPDHAIFQIWGSRLRPPNLPDGQPGTFTNLVRRYAAAPSAISLLRENGRVTGRLAGSDGQPIQGVDVALTARDEGSARVMSVRQVKGRVPDLAARAVVGLRINTECNCTGPADLALGPIRYRQDGNQTESGLSWPNRRQSEVRAILARPGQAIADNTQPFPVTPGAQFALEVPMRVAPESEGSGYLAVIFQDLTGKEIRRQKLSFQPGRVRIGAAVTNADGRYSVQIPNPEDAGAADFVARFEGNLRHRPSSSQMQ